MPDRVPIAPGDPNRRALILPGGGMRVAWQAGALKALHETGLRFSFADGASGGTMNLAALLGGATPDQLCGRWRTLNVRRFVSPRSIAAYLRFPATGALGDFDGIDAHVFPHLGIDAAAVRAATGVNASFNVCDFDEKIAVSVPHRDIRHEQLLAAISLPIMMPPVRHDGRTWTDSVWIRDSNLLGAVGAGANELWVLWCIGNTPTFRPGLLDQYVHMIEMAALGQLHREFAEIARLNERIAAGERPYGHETPITVHLVKPDKPIPLDPDFLLGKVDAATLVSYGYRDATRYLRAYSPDGVTLRPLSSRMEDIGEGVSFREVMTGRITLGETDPVRGAANDAAFPVSLHGTIDIDDIRAFVRHPQHRAALAGHLEIQRLGGWFPAARGNFGLFSPTENPALTHMVYEMAVSIGGRPMWFKGRKHVRIAGPWALWPATTTLYVTLHDGQDDGAPVIGAGILRLGIPALISLLATLHATGCDHWWAKLRANARFLRFFGGQLVRTYLLRRRL